jgi:hypothetical protein
LNNYIKDFLFVIIIDKSKDLLSMNEGILFIVKRLSALLIIYSTALKINFVIKNYRGYCHTTSIKWLNLGKAMLHQVKITYVPKLHKPVIVT